MLISPASNITGLSGNPDTPASLASGGYRPETSEIDASHPGQPEECPRFGGGFLCRIVSVIGVASGWGQDDTLTKIKL